MSAVDLYLSRGEALPPSMAQAVSQALTMIAGHLRHTAATPAHPALVRRRIGDVVGALIEVADCLSGDEDLESDNDDEPSLGWASDRGPTAKDSLDDREADAGDEPEARDPDFEQTAIDTFGRGFPPDRTGDDDEDGHGQ